MERRIPLFARPKMFRCVFGAAVGKASREGEGYVLYARANGTAAFGVGWAGNQESGARFRSQVVPRLPFGPPNLSRSASISWSQREALVQEGDAGESAKSVENTEAEAGGGGESGKEFGKEFGEKKRAEAEAGGGGESGKEFKENKQVEGEAVKPN